MTLPKPRRVRLTVNGTAATAGGSSSYFTSGTAVAPQTHVLQVGGTSIYRYHPLPGVNSAFELIKPAAAGGTSHGAVDPSVGGAGAYQYHPLP